MKTDLVYLDDSYAREATASVLAIIDNRFVILDRTVSYAQGGGQPGDTGALHAAGSVYKIVATTKHENEIMHDIGDAEGLRVGDTVRVSIDWPRRYAHMRYHTAAHILAAVLHNQAGALITGNQISEEKLRIDFSLEDYDPLRLQHYVAEANRLIRLDAPVSARTMPREEALQLPGMVKLAGALPPDVPQLRILTIGDERTGIIDEQADGGTHVHSTHEIGTLELVGTENKGKANRRVVVRLSTPE